MDSDATIISRQTAKSDDYVSFVDWKSPEIESWLAGLEFSPDLISQFTFNNITGDLLPYLTDEHLKELQINLKDRIRLKVEINKLITAGNYLNPNDINSIRLVLTNINQLIKTNIELQSKSIHEELMRIREDGARYNPFPTPEKNVASPFNLTSPTRKSSSSSSVTSPKEQQHQQFNFTRRLSEQRSKSNRSSSLLASSTSSSNLFQQQQPQQQPQQQQPQPQPQPQAYSPTRQSSTLQPSKPVSEPLKQLRASTDDPCSKVLQAAMKRHHLNDDWRNYALVICYGDQERILELDEKPVQIFKELKESGKHPAIMLRQKADFTIENGKKTSETPGGKL